jgi:1-acyl-sn-glycerol-3-phosphate acyltransferase
MSDQNPNTWKIPEGYYEWVANSNVNAVVHRVGRTVMQPVRYVLHGTPLIEMTEEFDHNRLNGTLAAGNVIITATHRSRLETVTQPEIFEEVGLHHARPVTKVETNMTNPVRRLAMHKLGAFAVDKKRPDVKGVSHAMKGILQRGGIITVYVEGTRIFSDISTVAKVETGAIVAAIQNDSLLIPQATAGLSALKVRDDTGVRTTIARDRKAPLGREPRRLWKPGLAVVHAFGDPYRLPRPDFEFSLERGSGAKNFRQSREFVAGCTEIVRGRLQEVLTQAYSIRGSMLEDICD